MWLGVRGGAGFPSGNFNEIANSGWDVGGTIGWMYNQHSGLGVDIVHHNWGGGPNAKAEAVGGPGAGFSPSALQVTACYVRGFPTEGSAFPWFKLGIGTYVSEMKVEGGQVDSPNRTNSLGANIGIGTDFAIGPGWQMGMSGTYHHFQRMKVPPPGPTYIFIPNQDGGDAEAPGLHHRCRTDMEDRRSTRALSERRPVPRPPARDAAAARGSVRRG
jgi:hypothetical protein